MPNTFETSFIPQQPLVRVEGKSRRREPVNLALILALIVFFISLAVAGGIYLYEIQVEKKVAEKQKELASLEEKINIDNIQLYKRTATRLSTAKALLDGHKAFSSVLNFLEEATAQNIGFTQLSYGKSGENYVLTLQGEALNYSAVYFQAEAWRNMYGENTKFPYVKSVAINNLALNEMSGIVGFTAQIVFNPGRLVYKQLLKDEKERLYQEGNADEGKSAVSSPSQNNATPLPAMTNSTSL